MIYQRLIIKSWSEIDKMWRRKDFRDGTTESIYYYLKNGLIVLAVLQRPI